MAVVHVACKLPSGIQLDGVKIDGVAHDRVAGAPALPMPGGYAITMNVPADLWDRWLLANGQSRMVTHDLVFADANLAALKAKAQSLGHVRSGFESR